MIHTNIFFFFCDNLYTYIKCVCLLNNVESIAHLYNVLFVNVNYTSKTMLHTDPDISIFLLQVELPDFLMIPCTSKALALLQKVCNFPGRILWRHREGLSILHLQDIN
jgi:hypothetical protein